MLAFKLLLPILLVVVPALAFAWFISTKFSLSIGLSQAFDVSAPSKTTEKGSTISIRIPGIDGDSVVIHASDPLNPETTPSEKLVLAEKKEIEIMESLSGYEMGRWEFLANLPTAVFRFDVLIQSDVESPNNSKKDSYFLIKNSTPELVKILPGETEVVLRSQNVKNLPTLLSKIEVELIYEHGMRAEFYDLNNVLVSQSTGKIIIKPTPLTQLLIILGVWASWLGFLLLAKETLLFSRHLQDIITFLKR